MKTWVEGEICVWEFVFRKELEEGRVAKIKYIVYMCEILKEQI